MLYKLVLIILAASAKSASVQEGRRLSSSGCTNAIDPLITQLSSYSDDLCAGTGETLSRGLSGMVTDSSGCDADTVFAPIAAATTCAGLSQAFRDLCTNLANDCAQDSSSEGETARSMWPARACTRASLNTHQRDICLVAPLPCTAGDSPSSPSSDSSPSAPSPPDNVVVLTMSGTGTVSTYTSSKRRTIQQALAAALAGMGVAIPRSAVSLTIEAASGRRLAQALIARQLQTAGVTITAEITVPTSSPVSADAVRGNLANGAVQEQLTTLMNTIPGVTISNLAVTGGGGGMSGGIIVLIIILVLAVPGAIGIFLMMKKKPKEPTKVVAQP